MRKEYKLSEEQHQELLDVCKPVPYMVFDGREPLSPQENANRAWCSLGKKMGFDGMSVRPVMGNSRYFTAEEVADEG